MNVWEAAPLPPVLFPCVDCIMGHFSSWQSHKLIWYDGNGDIYDGPLPEGEEPDKEEDRIKAGWRCLECKKWFLKGPNVTESNFGPTLSNELERRASLI